MINSDTKFKLTDLGVIRLEELRDEDRSQLNPEEFILQNLETDLGSLEDLLYWDSISAEIARAYEVSYLPHHTILTRSGTESLLRRLFEAGYIEVA